jgi:hypothetical protein
MGINAADSWQALCARNGEPSYRIKAPHSWQRHPTPSTADLSDTKQAICTYNIDSIRITIHTFPSQKIEDRISPQAQIARWKQQFESLDPATVNITPQAYSGYAGLLFEGTGRLNGEHTTVMAWSMQLAPEHYRQLFYNRPLDVDLRADFTIKAVGPAEIMSLYRQALIAFARSFELIKEIDSRP